ncbi:hypothetical protein DSO57_1012873 [Entomophthora muscae]|uniref:Uncharacterized protein n=1 Tax=Entomophthora muscae TaxID=34485 RepID=A0ACC2TTM4_9FUNG|nr:hypothetical protein DSO57_1012873 [Entomophthora muscae]
MDLLEPSPVDHNIRGEDSSKDDDVVLHEFEIVGLHAFQKPPFSPPESLTPEDPGTNPHGSSLIPLLALPHCKKDSKTELLHLDEMQEPQDLPLPTVAIVSSIADELYEKLLVDQSLWEEEPSEIQSVIKKLSVDKKVKDGQLFKLYKDIWLSYVCLSLRTDSEVASHKATGHGGI